MAVSSADFLARFPVFDGAPTPTLEALLADANETFNEHRFSSGKAYRRAVMLLTAHELVLAGLGQSTEANLVNQGLTTDMVQSVSDGGVSVSLKADQATSGSIYGATSYGRELAKLLRSAIVPGLVGGSNAIKSIRTNPVPVTPISGVPISGSPNNIIEQRTDGLFAAPKLHSNEW